MRTSLLLTLAAAALAAPLAAGAAPLSLPASRPALAVTTVQYYGPPPDWRQREEWRLEREREWRRQHEWEWRHAHHDYGRY